MNWKTLAKRHLRKVGLTPDQYENSVVEYLAKVLELVYRQGKLEGGQRG